MSGCLASEIPDWILKPVGTRRATRWIGSSRTLGPENFYSNWQNHGIAEQAKVNKHLILWAKEFGLKNSIATEIDVIKSRKAIRMPDDCLIGIGTQTQLAGHETDAPRAGAVLPAHGGGNEGALCDTPEGHLRNNARSRRGRCQLGIKFQRPPANCTSRFCAPETFHARRLSAQADRGRVAQCAYTIHAKARARRFVVRELMTPNG